PYREADEAATIELWQQTWQQAYPAIDFAARVDWWRERWRGELVPSAAIVVAESAGVAVGFLAGEPASGGGVPLLGSPRALWGAGVAEMLLDDAKRLSPSRLALHVNKDNARAVRFYQKRGFAIAGEDVNPRSGAPVYLMTWASSE